MAQPKKLTAEDIRRLLELLETELAEEEAEGEIYLVGGAVMCLALDARPPHATWTPTSSPRS